MGEVFSFNQWGHDFQYQCAVFKITHDRHLANRFKDFIVSDNTECIWDYDDDGDYDCVLASVSSGISKTWRWESITKPGNVVCVFRALVSFTSYFSLCGLEQRSWWEG